MTATIEFLYNLYSNVMLSLDNKELEQVTSRRFSFHNEGEKLYDSFGTIVLCEQQTTFR